MFLPLVSHLGRSCLTGNFACVWLADTNCTRENKYMFHTAVVGNVGSSTLGFELGVMSYGLPVPVDSKLREHLPCCSAIDRCLDCCLIVLIELCGIDLVPSEGDAKREHVSERGEGILQRLLAQGRSPIGILPPLWV